MAMPRDIVKRVIDQVSKISHIVGQSLTMIMVFLITADVIMRYVFNDPIGGVLELTELMMVVLVFLSFGYVELEDANVRVELVTARLKPRVRAYVECFNALVAICLFALIAWQSVPRSLLMLRRGDMTGYLHIPEGPFLLVISFGCAVMCLQLIFRLRRFFIQAKSKE
jgi:TRAP-type C4-dicarboxylate transport system permease small subunit